MPKGPKWNESWDRLLIMFKYLTTMQYERIAWELREIGKPWCTIVTHDIRSRLRHKWNASLGLAIEIALPSWPFSMDLKMGNGLRGEDFRDVKVFIEEVVQYEDLNETGRMYAAALQHMRDNPHLFPDNGVPENMHPPDWMGYSEEDEESDPRPAVQIAAASRSPSAPEEHMDFTENDPIQRSPPKQYNYREMDHPSLTQPGDTPPGYHRMLPPGYIPYPGYQPQASRPRTTPPTPPRRVSDPEYRMTLEAQDKVHKVFHPVLIASLDQIQKLANGTMSLIQFGNATRGSAITVNPRPNIKNPVFVKQYDDIYGLHPEEAGFPYAAATTVMYERLYRGETSLDEFMASLPSVDLAYLTEPSVAGQPQAHRLVALNSVAPPPRFYEKRPKRKRNVERPEYQDVEEDQGVIDVADFDIDMDPYDENPFNVNPFEGDPFESLHKRRRTETPTGVQVGTLAQRQAQRKRDAASRTGSRARK
jgi:hypothetical protein